MLVTHTGDVTETRVGISPGTWILVVTDQTMALSVVCQCKGALADAAKLTKVGQVVEVVGITNRPPAGSRFQIIPIMLRAKSGVNEADINKISAEYTNGLVEGKSPAMEAELSKVKAELFALATAKVEVDRQNTLLHDKINMLERDLTAERIMNSALEMP